MRFVFVRFGLSYDDTYSTVFLQVRFCSAVIAHPCRLLPRSARLLSFGGGFLQEGMGLPLSGFDQWQAIIGNRSEEVDGPVRRELVLGRSSYTFDPDALGMSLLPTPRGGYIYDGWKIVVGDRYVAVW